MNKYSRTSLDRLKTCHPELQRLFHEVLIEQDHTVISGFRGFEEQNYLYHSNKSQLKFPDSKHNHTILDRETNQQIPESLAVDVLPYDFRVGRMINGDQEGDKERILSFATFVFKKSLELGIYVVWGGNWKTFKDMPHWEYHGRFTRG